MFRIIINTLFLAVITLSANSYAAADVFYDGAKLSNNNIQNVIFRNKAELSVLVQKDYAVGNQQLILKSSGDGRTSVFIEDDIVSIDYVYPDNKSAIFAIVTGACSGNACSSSTYLVTPENKGLAKYLIADGTFKFNAKVSNEKILSANVTNIYIGTDSYGDKKFGNLKYFDGKGFVDPNAKPIYKKLIGAYSFDFFEEKKLREPLVRMIGTERFKNLRNVMETSFPSELIRNRYVLFSGCMAHSCGSKYTGSVLIDIVTDDVWWFYQNDSARQFGGTRKFDSAEIQNLRSILEAHEFSTDSLMSISADGEATLVPMNRRNRLP